MNESTAKSELLNRSSSISPGQFEQLCRILIKKSERTRELELTPLSGDDGIDVHAVIDRDLFQARLGVQAKRNNQNNHISSNQMRLFKGSLDEGEYHVGTYITTSSFTDPAKQSAKQSYIRLIDGERLARIMLQSQIGINYDGEAYEVDWEFWDIFDVSGEGDLIRSDEVPQADTVEVLNYVLMSIDQGYDVKPTITEFLEEKTGQEWDPRQADYYPHAAWPLGFVHKDEKIEYKGNERRQWTLSRIGREYVNYLYEDKRTEAEELLFERIREMEIAKRVLNKLEKKQTLTHPELREIVDNNTYPEGHEHGLSMSTAHRRGDTIGKWIEKLPEVRRRGPNFTNSTYEYITTRLSDYSD